MPRLHGQWCPLTVILAHEMGCVFVVHGFEDRLQCNQDEDAKIMEIALEVSWDGIGIVNTVTKRDMASQVE